MLLEELDKPGNGNIECIVPIVVVHAIDVGLGREASALLEIAEGRLRLRIEDVGQRRKGATFRVEEETTLLEEERDSLLSPQSDRGSEDRSRRNQRW